MAETGGHGGHVAPIIKHEQSSPPLPPPQKLTKNYLVICVKYGFNTRGAIGESAAIVITTHDTTRLQAMNR